MSKRNITIEPQELAKRFTTEGIENAFHSNYKNPHILAFLYYTEGMSTTEIAEMLECEQRTVRRYMNYFGFKRFTKKFSALVKYHGVRGAMKIQPPEFYPLGIHND